MATKELKELPLSGICCVPQVREQLDSEVLEGLAQSLREIGLQQPILVRPIEGGWVVIDGHRRLAAAKLCGWEAIAAIVDDTSLSNADVVERQLVTACQRADLTPMEKARAIDGLMRETKWTAAHVAKRLGLSPAGVSKLLALLVLPPDAQRRVDAGELAASTAYEVAKIRNAGERARLLDEAAKGGLTRDRVTTRRRVRARDDGSPRSPRHRTRRERIVIPLGDRRSVTLVGPALTVPAVFVWLEELLGGLRSVAADATDVHELAKALAARRSAGGVQ